MSSYTDTEKLGVRMDIALCEILSHVDLTFE